MTIDKDNLGNKVTEKDINAIYLRAWPLKKEKYSGSCVRYVVDTVESQGDEERRWRFGSAALEIAEIFGKDKVVLTGAYYWQYVGVFGVFWLIQFVIRQIFKLFRKNYVMKALHKRHGRVGKLKRELKKAKRNDVVFCDLYTPDDARWEYFNLFVLMEKIDSELHRKTVCANGEKGDWPTTTVVFPHSMIRHQKNARETIKHYLNEEDILLEFEVQEYLFSMSVIINTQYISYRQFVEKIVPVFEKHGFHFNDLTDPFAEYSLADKRNSEKDTRVTMSVKICTKIFATILGRIGTLVGVFVGITIDDVLSKIKEIMHRSGE